MIPQKLTLSNFMCYRQATELDFADIHLACLTGHNGHGKSALLDATTWALWGKARASSSDELVSTGERDMSVQFEFSLDDVQYRVLRSRELSGKRGKGYLELQTAAGDAWTPLTGPTMRETQDQINRLLRMDYDTFINSAFLVQGRADEFTVKAPAERKQVLSDILGLALYDRYAEAAKITASEHKRAQEVAEGMIGVLQEDLSNRAECETDLGLAEGHADSVAVMIEAKQQDIDRLEVAEKRLIEQRAELVAVQQGMEDLEKQERRLHLDVLQSQAWAEDAQAILDRKDEITEGYEALAEARQVVSDHADKLAELRPLTEEKSRLDAAIVAKGHDYDLEHQATFAGLQQAFTRATYLVEQEEARVTRFEKFTGTCPICEQELPEDKRQGMLAEARDELSRLATDSALAERRIAEWQNVRRPADAELAPEETAALAVLLEQIDALGYDHAKAQEAKERRQQLVVFEEEWISLGKAETTIAEVNRTTAEAEERRAEIAQKLQAEREKAFALDDKIAKVGRHIVLPLAAAKLAMTALRNQEREALDDIATLQERLKRLDEQQVKLEQAQAQLTEATENHTLYTELQTAFGRNGIQALLIDEAIPELEAEANALLGRMTEGRMSVQLETQRDNKSGTVRETLDILIADEYGPRSYEMFSGGEAFRINFAIRIALSKLLARRAGAQLRTLIIDEGFGSQDTAGRESLVQAINSVSDDFARVLVVTHIEELKDAFPVRIDVCKTPGGSQITVN